MIQFSRRIEGNCDLELANMASAGETCLHVETKRFVSTVNSVNENHKGSFIWGTEDNEEWRLSEGRGGVLPTLAVGQKGNAQWVEWV